MRWSSTLNSLRMSARTFMVSFSLSSRRLGGSLVLAPRPAPPARGGPSRDAVPAARVVAHRRKEDVPAGFRQIDRVATHHRRVRAAEPVQRDNQRVLLVWRSPSRTRTGRTGCPRSYRRSGTSGFARVDRPAPHHGRRAPAPVASAPRVPAPRVPEHRVACARTDDVNETASAANVNATAHRLCGNTLQCHFI